ncbi:leucine zipper-like transcriptional [Cyclospora cayetanensis]|uniref:Leucine zipper-like transcriptional n=1 Tax=Cyclospora cayetanensis TaxID=88456 RepID=A0A1D3D7Q6_9EIME|nr:leucine zipper-like transcriptional [Cyclospora cayetanensis]
MPCEKCEAKLTRLVTPDVKEGSKRAVGVNKLIEKTTKKDKVVIVGSKCKVCRTGLHMKGKYCAPWHSRKQAFESKGNIKTPLLGYDERQGGLNRLQPEQQQHVETTDSLAMDMLPGWEPIKVVGTIRPERRSGAASCVYKNCLFVFGGYGGLSRLGNLFKFDFTTSEWREVTAAGAPSPRESNGAVVLGNKMFIFGGYSGSQWLNDLHTFDLENSPSASVWRAAAMRRYVAAANPLKGSILLFGGYDGCSWLNDLNQLNPQSLEWRPVHQRGLIPSGRSCPAAATHEQGLFLFGGYNGVERLSDLFRFDLNTEVWTVITTYSGPRSSTPNPGQHCCWQEPLEGVAVARISGEEEEPAAAASAAAAAAEAAALQPLQQGRSPASSSCSCCSSPVSCSRSDGYSHREACCSCYAGSLACCTGMRAYTAYAGGGGGSKSNGGSKGSSGSNSDGGGSRCCNSGKHGGGPTARYFHAACAKDGKLFAFGGYSGQERLSDFHELDLDAFCGSRLRLHVRSEICHDEGLPRLLTLCVAGKKEAAFRAEIREYPLSPPPSTLLSDLLSLQVPGVLADAVFLVEGRKEARDRATTPIPIEGIRHEVFVALLEYLHTDFLPRGLSWPVLVELMMAAERVNSIHSTSCMRLCLLSCRAHPSVRSGCKGVALAARGW